MASCNLETRVMGNLALIQTNMALPEEVFEKKPYRQLKWSGPSAGLFSGNYENPTRLRFVLLKHENYFGEGSGLYEIVTIKASVGDSSTLAKQVRERYEWPDTKRMAVGEINIERTNNDYTIAMFGFMDHAGDTCNTILLPLITGKISQLDIPPTIQMKYRLIDSRRLH